MNFKKDKKEQVKQEEQIPEQETIQPDASEAVSSDEKENEKVQEYEKEIQELKDKLLRKAAEFDNYKRRTENDQLNLLKYAAENFIIKLLPVVDDFERSLQHIKGTTDTEKIKEGIQLVYDKFTKMLEDQGVKKINSKGEPFDVNFHEAILQRPDDSVKPHTVLEEIESGYMYKDRVIRHAKVIVSEDTNQ